MVEQTGKESKLGAIRHTIFPVYNKELPKLIPLFISFFLIAFVFSLLRPAKIALILSSKGTGAEVIPFLKVYAVLPVAIFFMFIISKLSNRITREKVFYIITMIFLSFFLIFITYLYPNRESLELTTIANYLEAHLPTGISGFISMIRYWPISLFYVIAELWATVILTTLFWGFINEVTTISEAARFYALFSFSANLSGIFAGHINSFILDRPYMKYLSFLGNSENEQHLSITMLIIISCIFLILAVFCYVNSNINLYNRREDDLGKNNKKKYKLSVFECFSYVMRYRYLSYIAIIVISYSIFNNLTEVIWQAQVKSFFTDQDSISRYVGQTTLIIGYISAPLDLFLTGNVIRRLGWYTAAMVTPLVAAVTGLFFYSTVLANHFQYYDYINFMIANYSINMVIIFGTLHVCSTRGLKYTLFDASKEIAYIPISTEAQRKGKAAIDGVCSRFGKSGGSIIYQAMFLIFGSLTASTPYVIGIIIFLIIFWLWAVIGLNKEMQKNTSILS